MKIKLLAFFLTLFLSNAVMAAPPGNELVYHGDFNGDNNADMLFRNKTSGKWYMTLRNGVGVLDADFVDIPSDLDWEIAGIGKLDNDNNSDVLLRSRITGKWRTYMLNGITVKATGNIKATQNLNYELQALADINGDGRSDLIVREATDWDPLIDFSSRPNLKWYYYLVGSDGNSVIPVDNSRLDITTNLDWELVDVKDLNGDNRADVILRNDRTGKWYGYLLSGAGVDQSGAIQATRNHDYVVQAIADLDADGNNDIVMRNLVTGKWYGYIMNGLLVSSEGKIAASRNLDYETVSITNMSVGQGADILLRNRLTGKWFIWLMKGLTVDALKKYDATRNLDYYPVAIADFDADNDADVLVRRAGNNKWYTFISASGEVAGGGFTGASQNRQWQMVEPATITKYIRGSAPVNSIDQYIVDVTMAATLELKAIDQSATLDFYAQDRFFTQFSYTENGFTCTNCTIVIDGEFIDLKTLGVAGKTYGVLAIPETSDLDIVRELRIGIQPYLSGGRYTLKIVSSPEGLSDLWQNYGGPFNVAQQPQPL